jgi:hypothetical protein
MAGKYDFEAAIMFATQTASGSFNATLDTITTSCSDAQGLILGASGFGIGDTGIDFGINRELVEAALIAGSFDRGLSTFLRAEPTFTFSFPFCGNRADASNPPVDADFPPITAIDALLEGAGMTGTASGTPGHIYNFAGTYPDPISCLLWLSGNRFELLDCRVSLSIEFPAGSVAIGTATIAVGSIKDHSAAAIPTTLNYNEQSTVSQPTVVSVGNSWENTKGFQTLTVDIAPDISDIEDANETTGYAKEPTNRVVTLSGAFFDVDDTDKLFGYRQVVADAVGELDQLQFQVADDAVLSTPCDAVQITVPRPEAQSYSYAKLGSKAGGDWEMVARGNAGNDSLQIEFR